MWRSVVAFIVLLHLGARSELVYFNLIFRHGARTPLCPTFPNDLYYNLTSSQCGVLLKSGKLQGYQLGQSLRQRYNTLLGSKYSSQQFELYSDEYVRVQETALTAMAGLWPPSSDDQFTKLNWQPVTYQFRSYYPKANKSAYLYVHDLPEFQEKLTPYKETVDYVTKHSGISSFNKLSTVYTTIQAHSAMGLPPLNWTKSPLVDSLSSVAYLVHAASAFTQELRVNGCDLVAEWLASMENATIPGNLIKAKLYAAHDDSMIAVMQCLGLTKLLFPSFASNLGTELHKLEDGYFVKVVDQRNKDFPLEVVTIPECDALCPFDKFKTIIKNRINIQ